MVRFNSLTKHDTNYSDNKKEDQTLDVDNCININFDADFFN